MRFNENDTVRLNFFFRVTSIRGCPTFRGTTLSRVAVPSFVKTCEFLPRNYVARILDDQRKNIYIYIYIFFPLSSLWKTRQHLCEFSSCTSLHICTRRLEFFYFPRFVPRNDFPPLNERVNFARDALFAYHRALPAFFCSRTRQGTVSLLFKLESLNLLRTIGRFYTCRTALNPATRP